MHKKTIYIDSTSTRICDIDGSRVDIVTMTYHDLLLLKFCVRDGDKNALDLTGYTFTFELHSDYQETTELISSDNSQFIYGDDTSWWSLVNGKITCRADLNQASIINYLEDSGTKPVYATLWATISGINYLLALFTINLNNSVRTF
jgi:hypothetical protein